jgi:hypothetical protein
MTLLEVGSYDGWILTKLCERIEFLEVIGVEARRKNITKGEVGRKLANVKTCASFLQGNLSDVYELVEGKSFDIVLCLGMLHHVSSTYDSVSQLCKVAQKMLIIDSMIVPELGDAAKNLERFVNTRDVIYHEEASQWSIAAFKHESPYGDGSRSDYGIVNIPSESLIRMSMQNRGFGQMQALGNETDYFDTSGQKLRGVKELLIAGTRLTSINDLNQHWIKKVEKIETTFCHKILPGTLVASLVKNCSEFKNLNTYDELEDILGEMPTRSIDELVSDIMANGLTLELKASIQKNVQGMENEHFEILGVIFRNPFEKIALETGKYLLNKKRSDIAVNYLQSITSKPGCDWWSFYRSCYLLHIAFRESGNPEKSYYYKKLLFLSNENFPLT